MTTKDLINTIEDMKKTGILLPEEMENPEIFFKTIEEVIR